MMVIPEDLFIDIIYNQASWNLQMSDTQTSYEHLKFNYGACSTMFYLCLEQKSGWYCHTTLVRGMGAVSFSQAQHQ